MTDRLFYTDPYLREFDAKGVRRQPREGRALVPLGRTPLWPTPAVRPADIAAAENDANRIVWEDRPVSIRFADSEEAARMPLRKEPKREGRLRLIDVEGFDLSACGGTHVARTGAIGIIAVGSAERFKGGQRIEFLCGERALTRFRALRDAAAASMPLLSVAPAHVP